MLSMRPALTRHRAFHAPLSSWVSRPCSRCSQWRCTLGGADAHSGDPLGGGADRIVRRSESAAEVHAKLSRMLPKLKELLDTLG